METPSTEPKGILWLLTFRVSTVTLLMGVTAAVQMREEGEFLSPSLIYIYSIVGLSYLLTLTSAVSLRFINNTERLSNLQIVADIVLFSLLIFVTGGIDSPFSFAYIFIIIWAGIVLEGRGIFLTASLSSIIYGALLDLEYYGFIPKIDSPLSQIQAYSESQVLYKIFVNIFAFYTVAFLSNHLFLQIRKVGQRLKEKEIDLKALEALNNKIIQEISSGLLTIDYEGRITSFNRAAEEITGRTFNEAYQTHISHLFPGLFERIVEYKNTVSYLKRADRWEMAFTGREGEHMHLGFSLSSLRDHNGEDIGSIIIFQNLTSYKQMEDTVKRAERLSSLGTLAAGIAHEIRNPLASMSGSIQVLRDGLGPEEDNRRLADIVMREIDRLNRLISDFLEYARPCLIEENEVNLSNVVDETLAIFSNGMKDTERIRLNKSVFPNVVVTGESSRLKDVLWNLLNNALQSINDRGEISVFLLCTEGRAVLEVTDTGEGIDESDLPKIFEPFFTTKHHGTGLGLATVQKLVEAHGGTVKVRSKRGKGTSFTVFLPLKR